MKVSLGYFIVGFAIGVAIKKIVKRRKPPI
jgi:uncharacterized membrane protein (Fun14 family)